MPPVTGVHLRVRDVSSSLTLNERRFLDPLDAAGTIVAPQLVTPPVVRLTTTAELHAPPGSSNLGTRDDDALIDTGAWVSMVADGTWQEYERLGLIERLEHPTDGTGPCGWATIGGGRALYSWGRIWVRLLDPANDPLDPNYIPVHTMPVAVQLLHTPPGTSNKPAVAFPILFGMNLGILTGTRLVCHPVRRWVAVPRDSHDCGTEIGQEWFLQTT